MRSCLTSVLVVLVLVLAIALITNPTRTQHKNAIVEQIERIASSEFGLIGDISNKIGLTQVVISDSDIIYHNFYILSITTNKKDELVSFGIFSQIIVGQ